MARTLDIYNAYENGSAKERAELILANYCTFNFIIEDFRARLIYALNDEDGELRLSIMATLAQNESKKISQRVKAGQMISFKNGVLYGNGNILGYDKIGEDMIVNKEQAKTVKRIFELYLSGYGVRKIQDIMEQEGYKTATGLTKWSSGNISRILKNSFYCGRIEYRKQYVPDYLTQKKINNHGEIERVYVDGTHEIIISPEDFDKAQEIRKSRTVTKIDSIGNEKKMGKSQCKNVWAAKCRCKCGHAMNRRVSYYAKKKTNSYVFQCYDQLHTGSPTARAKKGLSTEGICDNTSFMGWKLELMADFIFKKLVNNRQAIYEEAISMTEDLKEFSGGDSNDKERIESNIRQIDKLERQIAVLVDLCTEGDISREDFRKKKKKLENQIMNLEQSNNEHRQNILEAENDRIKLHRIESLTEFIKMKAYDPRAKIPEMVIDAFVDKVIYDKGTFTWYLNPKLGNDIFSVDATDWKKSKMKDGKLMFSACPCTGSDCAEERIKIISNFGRSHGDRKITVAPFFVC